VPQGKETKGHLNLAAMRSPSVLVAAATVAAAGFCSVLFLSSEDDSWLRAYFLRDHTHGGDGAVLPDAQGPPMKPPGTNLDEWRRLDHRPSSFGTQQLVLTPEYATYVSKAEPDRNFRRDDVVEVDDDPDRKDIVIGFSGNSFLSQVRSVTLEMECADESDDGGTVYESEERLSKYVTWDSRPSDFKSHLTKVGGVGAAYRGRVAKVDVSTLIYYGRLHSEITLVIRPESKNGAKFVKDSIKLVVRYGGKTGDDGDNDEDDDDADAEKNNKDDTREGIFAVGQSSPFQLMMWWERDYFWQETFSRRRWCATCGRGEGKRCKEGEHVRIVKCKSDDQVQHWVRDGSRICAYTDKSLCWDYRTRDFTLRRRNSSPAQDFLARPFFSVRTDVSKTYRFELWRRTKSGCVTQLHHPRSFEHLMSRRCELARKSKTSYWVAVVPKIDGH